MGSEYQIETVRGGLDGTPAAEVLEFWGRTAGFTGAAAQARLSEVVALVRHDGALAGVSSVFPATVGQVAGRSVHVLRALLPGGAVAARPALISRVFAALEEAYDEAPESPAGLCVLADAAERRARPQAVWDEPQMFHAGYLADGRQIRIAYFADELSRRYRSGDYAPTEPRGASYRILDWAEQDELGAEAVVSMWTSEGVLAAEEAERRVGELLMVAVDADGRPAGACTGYVQRSEQLRGDFWHVRMFVAAAHRRSHLAGQLGDAYRGLLGRRYAAGDRRALGIIYEVENAELIRHPPRGTWPSGPFFYIATNPGGAQVRVHYFAGAPAPGP